MLRESDNSMMAISSRIDSDPDGSIAFSNTMPTFQATSVQEISTTLDFQRPSPEIVHGNLPNDHLGQWQLRASPGTTTVQRLNSSQWNLIKRGLRQRFEAVNACLDEIVCRKKTPEYLRECPFIEGQIRTLLGPLTETSRSSVAWTWFGSTDLYLDADGQLTVMDHNFSLPTGLDLLMSGNDSINSSLLKSLLTVPESSISSGVTVVLLPGLYSSTSRGNEFLARSLNAYAARSTDLIVRADGVYFHVGGKQVRVSTIIRRIDDDLLDPNCFRPDSLVGVPGLIRAWKQGLVEVLNPPGVSLANCRTFGKLMARIIIELLGQEPVLPSAIVLECEDNAVLKHVMTNLPGFAVRTNDPLHPARPFFGRTGMTVEFADLLTRLRKNPAAYVARPLLPEGKEDGLNLRVFAACHNDFEVIPAAIGRRCQPDGGVSLAIGIGEQTITVL